jgi:hypothetical protein
MNQLKALSKLVRSFGKTDWSLDHYPIDVFEWPPSQESETGRWKPFTWTAQIINWENIRGDGYSREEAMADLADAFQKYKATHDCLPRPGLGAKMEITFAPMVEVERYPDLSRDILSRVLGMDPDECLITDESSLWDFHNGETNDEYISKIILLYGVDISDMDQPKISAICKRIDEHRR